MHNFLGHVIIIGGGLAGLISATQLRKRGISCTVIEKKSYPLHRVCGEYVSNEAVPFLKTQGLFPEKFSPPHIDEFLLSSVTGKESTLKLDLGGFGISRFAFDHFLYERAKDCGVTFMLETEAEKISFEGDQFCVETSDTKLTGDVVIGAFGKRSKLDGILNRSFFGKRSPFVGIKYHVHTDHPANRISLHNFEGGYCGINKVENGVANICYLADRESLRRYGNVADFESRVLFRNPHLESLFRNSDFLFPRPEVINEISFDTKLPVEQHILMAGDAAGMIAPLCGNGMAIAIHSAKIAAEIIPPFLQRKITRAEMEQQYTRAWTRNFSARLSIGRKIQKLFGNKSLSNLAVNLVLLSKPLARILVRNTHGKPF